MSPEHTADRAAGPRLASAEPLLLALGIALAFSPVAADWALHWLETPWSRYGLLFPLLFALAARRERPEASAAPRSGLLCIAGGLALELVAAFAGAIRWARVGLALAAFGWSRRSAIASARISALLFFAVPAPAFAVHAGSAALIDGLWALLATVGFGVPERLSAAALEARGALVLAPLLAGLAWYEACLFDRSLPRTAAHAAAAALAALPLLALAQIATAAALAAGWEPARAGLFLRWAWLAAAGAGLPWLEWRWRRRGPA